MLEGLPSVENAVISQVYPVITILKLKPNNSFNPESYRGVHGHFMLLPQNTEPLLYLLPSKTTHVDKVVRVMWEGKLLPQTEQLILFVSIRKHCVIDALHWLIANNLLYKNIGINHQLLETWDEKFIPSSIIETLVHCDSDQHKRQYYTIDLCDGNFENDLNATIASGGIEGDHINSGCVYINIDDGRQNPIL